MSEEPKESLNLLGKIAHNRAMHKKLRKEKEPPVYTCPICGKKRSSLRIVNKKLMCIYCKRNKKYLERE